MSDDPTNRAKPPCRRDEALAVLVRLRQAGHEAYFAGGCVRDQLLGREPADFDVATSATPDRVRRIFPATQAVGAAFGVILVRQGSSTVEVATFRTDASYADGRRPSAVRFATARDDAQRRDFTINGLFLDPLNNQVIDYVGGQDDLAHRVLRAIGRPDDRFAEDHLRLLRAVRFAARFGLSIEPLTAQGIAHYAARIVRISPERIADELRLMLTPVQRSAAWTMLWQYALIQPVFRFVASDTPTSFAPQRSIFLATAPAQPIPFALALAAASACLLMQRMPPEADVCSLLNPPVIQHVLRGLRQGLRISNDESDQVRAIFQTIQPLLGNSEPSLAQRKRFMATPTAPLARLLLNALARIGQHSQRIAQLQQRLTEIESIDCAPSPLITGDDLIAAGFQPGPAFKRILDAVYDDQLESRISSRAQALDMALRLRQDHPG